MTLPSRGLRENRAALQGAGLDPCEALVSFAAIGASPQEVFASRGWTAAEWAAAFESGLLPAQSTLGIATVPAPALRP